MKKIIIFTSIITFLYLTNLSFSQDCAGELLCSKFESQKVVTSMAPGETQMVSVTFKNTGSSSWSTGTVDLQYGDARANPENNNVWNINKIPMQQRVTTPDGDAEFRFVITAPTKSGIYDFQWQVRSNGTPFGALSTPVQIKVK